MRTRATARARALLGHRRRRCCAAPGRAWPGASTGSRPPGRVLDVGAGDGSLLDALGRRGREALGLERDRGAPDVRDADITEIEGDWSAIVFWHSLEHLPAPGPGARRRAPRELRPGASCSWPFPTRRACRRARSATAGCTWTFRGTWCTSRRAR